MPKKGGGLWGTIRSQLVEDDGSPSAPAAPPATAPAPTWTPPPGVPILSGAPVSQPDPTVLAKLEEKVQAAMPPVYATFTAQFDALAKVIPDESMRFNAALVASGASVDQLSTAIDMILQTLKGASDDFNHRYEDQKARSAANAANQSDADNKLIATCQEQIKTLQAQIDALRAKVETETSESRTALSRLETVRLGFQAAYDQVVGRLQAQKNNIQRRKA